MMFAVAIKCKYFETQRKNCTVLEEMWKNFEKVLPSLFFPNLMLKRVVLNSFHHWSIFVTEKIPHTGDTDSLDRYG